MEQITSGFLLVNKPVGITSAHCLNKIKKLLPKKAKIKVGHAGTLDAFASGLLVVGIGRPATKQLSQIMQMDKRYEFTAHLGIETDTLDKTGTVVKQQDIPTITKLDLARTLKSFRPSYQQTPPLYSALKHKGRRLSDLVRQQKLSQQDLVTVATDKTRQVAIYSLQLLKTSLPLFTCEALVSHGTYIRSLVRDIGYRLGSCATTQQLRRTAIGGYTLEEAVDLEHLSASNLSSYIKQRTN